MTARTSVRFCSAAIFALAASMFALGEADEPRSTTAPQSILVGVGARGVFDPAVTRDPATRRLWMSYSSFDVSGHSQSGVNLRLASSEDGESWRDAGVVAGFTDVLVGPLTATDAGEAYADEGSRATWQNEASTLVYDESAPPEQRWKLFWHQVLWADDAPRYASYGWIALKMAGSPENLLRAAPTKLFTGYMARTAGESALPPAVSPLPGPPAIQLDKKDPQLAACMFGQPSAIAAPDGLYLTLDCAWLGTQARLHTVLLRCAYPGCNVMDAASWTVVGRLTEPADASRLDEQYKGFGGAALAERAGRYYLLATPITRDNRYDGCKVFRFEDIKQGKLERRRGRLVVAQSVPGTSETHHGACAAHEGLKGGILLSQIVSPAAPRVMQIRRSGVELPRD